MSLLENLKQKPERTRKRIAFGISGAITLMIFMVWIVTWHYNAPQNADAKVAETNPWDAVASVFSSGITSMKEQIGNFGQTTKNTNGGIEATTSSSSSYSMPAPATSTDAVYIYNSSY